MSFWINFVLLVTIHTADMLLTKRYIGDVWEFETFPIMAWCIKHLGGDGALWASRVAMYSILYGAVYLRNNRHVRIFLAMLNLLYWTSMIGWLFFLGYLSWPSTLPG